MTDDTRPTAADLRALTAEAEVERLKGVIAQHDLCHDLHGKVGAEDFARGCAAEQRRLYGRAPDADEVARLRAALREIVGCWDDRELEDGFAVASRMSAIAEGALGEED